MIHCFFNEYKVGDNYIPFLHFYESFKEMAVFGLTLNDKYEGIGWKCRYLKSAFSIDGYDYSYESPSAQKEIFVDGAKETKIDFPLIDEIYRIKESSDWKRIGRTWEDLNRKLLTQPKQYHYGTKFLDKVKMKKYREIYEQKVQGLRPL